MDKHMKLTAWLSIVVVASFPSLGCVIITEGHGGATSGSATSGSATSGSATSSSATGGSSSSGGDPALGACPELEGKTFASVPELECGRGPDGVALCHWHLTFQSGTAAKTEWTWQHSDYGEFGTVQCVGATLNATSDQLSAPTYKGSYDAAQKKLTWDTVEYTLMP